MYPNKKQQELI
ncbi:hypothetical protein LWG81_19965, partial [Clostridioides difficile]|nr:hypothetical protein [Clostridioides difficile]